ncbi:MAG: ORF6N domain-containing protein [Candidatus Omnitrophica bacterium]|nr:ORF6N domain-containing protein [Candidatus Omnitrophota bacterium]
MSKISGKLKLQGTLESDVLEQKIYWIRGKKVMLDSDLASLYGVATKQLNRQVKRNVGRFPEDFMFQITQDEFLRCQIGTFGSSQKGSRKYLPYVFTEHGILMLSSVLNSERAIQVNIQIMRTFSKIRQMLDAHKELRQKIEEMEQKYDSQFKVVFDALRQLLEPPEKTKRRIGFHTEE